MGNAWWKEKVVYQIYPRSFKDSNGDGIGDLRGIIEKLDYLLELGIDIIWLSPIYQSPNDDNGYDISDYYNIMNEFGSMEDFDELLQEAHQRKLKIILDIAFNHTSDEHEWFQKSKSVMKNEYWDYYIWKKGKNGGPPNNWGSYFGGPAWEYVKERDMYYLHLFSKKQPDLNWENKDVREEIKRILCWWIEKGVDGFRLDVINLLSKDCNFPDGEKMEGSSYGTSAPFTSNGPRVHEFIKELNRDVFEKYDVMTVGETLDTDDKDALLYTGFDRKELNMIFTFEHVNAGNDKGTKWTDKKPPLPELREILSRWQSTLNNKAWNSLYWENHDQPRAVSRFGNEGKYWNKSAKMLAVCLYMMQGTPYIYQGQELGMKNLYLDNIEEYQDIETKNAYRQLLKQENGNQEAVMRKIHAKSRDNARSPMQWNDSENAGFTEGTPWFTVNPNYREINAANQIEDTDSIYHFYRRLIQLRKQYPVITYGDYTLLEENNKEVYVYLRTWENEKILVMCNFSEEEQQIKMQSHLRTWRILIKNYDVMSEWKDSFVLRPYEAIVLYQQ